MIKQQRDLVLEQLTKHLAPAGWTVHTLRLQEDDKLLVVLQRGMVTSAGIKREVHRLEYDADLMASDLIKAIYVDLKILGCLSTFPQNA